MVMARNEGSAACPVRLAEGACDAEFANGRRHTCQKIMYIQFQNQNENGWFTGVHFVLKLNRVCLGRAIVARLAPGKTRAPP
jgi:hypothetical protein